MKSQTHSPLVVFEADVQAKLGSALQTVLWDLLELANQGKQAHWNVQGPLFQSVHEQLDAVVDEARNLSDEVAERVVQVGLPVDGRTSQVAKNTALAPIPEGTIGDTEAVRWVASCIATTVETIREQLEVVGPVDAISEDVLIQASRTLEKRLWMLRSQVPGA